MGWADSPPPTPLHGSKRCTVSQGSGQWFIFHFMKWVGGGGRDSCCSFCLRTRILSSTKGFCFTGGILITLFPALRDVARVLVFEKQLCK